MSMHVERGLWNSVIAVVLAVLAVGALGIPSPWSWVAVFVLYFVFAIALGLMRSAYESRRFPDEDEEPGDPPSR